MPDLITVNYEQNGSSIIENSMGMREMQARAYEKRNAQYLLLKAPPASGKSRALMFLALDKVRKQGLKKAIVTVPEMSIGGSFDDTKLSEYGYFADWHVAPEYNLCTPGDNGKVESVVEFLQSSPKEFLVCTHATFRFACQRLAELGLFGLFNNVLVAVDEFHHVSAEEGNQLGAWIDTLMEKTDAHIVAMTGSYFRGDAMPILSPKAEAQFETVVYSYYEQLNGYKYLKSLGLGYNFYQGKYTDALAETLDIDKKTIIHIPNVNSRESTGDKLREVGEIIDVLGKLVKQDPNTGIYTVKLKGSGRLIKVADLVTDTPIRSSVLAYLRAIAQEPDKEKQKGMVDIIIALGMAKEGFDWPWCEHVLTIGYRNSLTEVVQIIGRATRDCQGKTHAQFTNLIAQPNALDEDVKTAVNNLLKAITLSLLMEQVLVPPIRFVPRSDMKNLNPSGGGTVIVVDDETKPLSPTVKKLMTDGKVQEIVEKLLTNDTPEVSKPIVKPEQAKLFLEEDLPKIVLHYNPNLKQEEAKQVGYMVAAALAKRSDVEVPALFKNIKIDVTESSGGGKTPVIVDPPPPGPITMPGGGEQKPVNPNKGQHPLLANDKQYINVQMFDLDLIREVNPFQGAYEILSKTVTPAMLKTIQDTVVTKRSNVSEQEALALYPQVLEFKDNHGRWPTVTSNDDYEVRLAEVFAYVRAELAKRKREGK